MVQGAGVRRAIVRAAVWLLGTTVLAWPSIASAQQATQSRISIDTSAAIDTSVDGAGNRLTGLWVDAVISAGLGKGFEFIAWPLAQRIANTGVESADIWIATLRYQRAGRVGVRVDGGLLAAPVGLANFTVRRPHLNPTVGQPSSSLFTPLPQVEIRGPRGTLMGAMYPFGGQVSLSGQRWDARAAVIDTSPLRRRGVFADPKPPRFTNVIVGGGVTPLVGLHVGASVTRGGWMRAGESPTNTSERDATVVTVDSQFAIAHTELGVEWVRDAIETSAGTHVASGWFLQGEQTLAPRWFAGGRVERIEAPSVTLLGVQRQRTTTSEIVVGFRLTPEVTMRAGHRARQGYGQPAFVHQFVMSLVWWKRWI